MADNEEIKTLKEIEKMKSSLDKMKPMLEKESVSVNNLFAMLTDDLYQSISLFNKASTEDKETPGVTTFLDTAFISLLNF